jgi:hypothetical protein
MTHAIDPAVVERAAEAICALHEDLARTPWSEWGDQVRDRYRTDARAALSAIPEAIDGAFKFGDTVSKVGGDYTFDGTIQGVIVKRSGLTRYAVEDDRGILHIFNATQLRARTTDQKGDRHD